MPRLTLHIVDLSPPVRAVLMTVEILGLETKMVEVNMLAGETRSPEYIAKNPMRTVPVLEDGDFCLSDSHAINTYLVSKYGANKRAELYPNDYNTRAIIEQRLYFEASVMFTKLRETASTVFSGSGNGPTPQQAADIEDIYGILEKYLEKQDYIANDRMTLADISVVATLSNLEVFVPITEKFPKLLDWFSRMKETDFYKKANVPGLERSKNLLKSKIEQGSS